MKYIEELSTGDCFIYDSKKFLLTSDFRKNGSKLAYSLNDGSCCWINSQSAVESLEIYFIDPDGNITPIKNIK